MRIGISSGGLDLTAQHNFLKAMARVAQSSLRLSTMARINRGWDDPAGLISAESIRSDLNAIESVSASTSRAVGMIHVADSALSNVGSLVRSIRGNVLNVAGGMLSDDEVAARQLEIDSALAAIDRIGQSTSFGGQKVFVSNAQSAPQSSEVMQTFNFSIHGDQPSTLVLPKVDTSILGGEAGHLSDLATGGSASLTSGNWAKAVEILDTAQDQVLQGRAEAGAFQRYTIDSSQLLMDSMQENFGAALSAIADADVAQETSHLIQSQILARMSLTALSITSQQPRLWLALGAHDRR